MSDIAVVRRFNRLYTKHIGILRQSYLDSSFSLSEVRVLYEIAHRNRPTATAIAKDLDLDCLYCPDYTYNADHPDRYSADWALRCL